MLARVFAIVALLAGTAHAQPGAPRIPVPDPPPEPAPAPAAEPAPEPAPPPPPPSPPDPAWSAYDDAFARAAAGDRPGATTSLVDLAARWPHHPAGRRAVSLVQLYDTRDREPAPRRTLDPRAPTGLARGELVFWSTISGAFTASNICELLGCNSSRAYAAVVTGTVGGSLALSLLATRGGIAPGQAQLYNAAQTWGSWNALGVNDGFADSPEEAGIALGGQALGLAVGLGLWRSWQPTQGDVALANTCLLWSSVLTAYAHLALESNDLSLGRVVIAGDVGLLLGALLSTRVKMSRGRTLLIDTGGVLGMLGGVLVSIEGRERDLGIGALVGTAGGLAIATLATRAWDDDVPISLSPTVMPGTTPGSTGFGVALSLHQ